MEAHNKMARVNTPVPLTPDHIADWSAWLRDEDDKVILARLRRNTSTGGSAGNDGFIDRLEAMLGHVLMPKKGERPRKQKKISRKGKKHG